MARTTTREIVRVCADIARLDRKGKQEVYDYLKEELTQVRFDAKPKKEPVTYTKGEE